MCSCLHTTHWTSSHPTRFRSRKERTPHVSRKEIGSDSFEDHKFFDPSSVPAEGTEDHHSHTVSCRASKFRGTGKVCSAMVVDPASLADSARSADPAKFADSARSADSARVANQAGTAIPAAVPNPAGSDTPAHQSMDQGPATDVSSSLIFPSLPRHISQSRLLDFMSMMTLMQRHFGEGTPAVTPETTAGPATNSPIPMHRRSPARLPSPDTRDNDTTRSPVRSSRSPTRRYWDFEDSPRSATCSRLPLRTSSSSESPARDRSPVDFKG